MKIDIGNGIKMNVQQGINDVKVGYMQNDLSRVSAYSGASSGVHTGSSSPTVGRHNTRFTTPKTNY